MANPNNLQILVNGIHINPVEKRVVGDTEIFEHFSDVLIELFDRHPNPIEFKDDIEKIITHICVPFNKIK